MFVVHDGFLVFPFHAEWRVGQHVVEALALEAVAGLAVAERVAQDNAAGVLVLDQHVRTADCPRFVVVFLPVQVQVRGGVLAEDELLRFGQHAAGAAGGVVDAADDPRPVNILFAGVDQVGHQPDHFARGKVVAGFFVGLFVETHHQMLEQVAHL